MMDRVYRLIQNIPFFKNLPVETLKSMVQSGSMHAYPAHETLFNEGDRGDALYLILIGEVDIRSRNAQGAENHLATLKAGAFFGELALSEGGVRTASAVTATACELFVLERSAFFKQLATSPELLSEVIAGISAKVRTVNQHLLEEQLQKQLLQLEINKVQRQTVARMVHGLSQELNLPLNLAQQQLETLLTDLPPEKLATGEELRYELNRISVLVQSLQAVIPGEAVTRQEEVFWPQFWIPLQEMYRASSFRKLPLQIQVSSAAMGRRWVGYPQQLSEILMHLLSNCEIHAYPLSQDPVVLSLDLEGEHFILQVEDKGLGMAPQVLKQIRTPFFSTRKHEGCSGLGLAVVDNLVSSVLGGTMSISSEAGEGTTVTLTLPVQAPVPTV